MPPSALLPSVGCHREPVIITAVQRRGGDGSYVVPDLPFVPPPSLTPIPNLFVHVNM